MIRRLLLTYLSLAVVVLAGLAVPLAVVHQRSEQQRAFSQLEHDAEILAAFVDAALVRGHAAEVSTLATDAAHRWGGSIEVVDGTGRPLAATGEAPPGPADLRAVLDGRTQVHSDIHDDLMSVAVPIHPGRVDQGAVRVSVPTTTLDTRIDQFRYLIGGVGLAVLIGAALVAIAMARWISRPVRTLERATRSLAEGDAPPAPTTIGPPELRRLAATFNTTAVRLQQLIAAQRSFVGHASHQLKTPLAALRLRLENLEPDVAADGEPNLRAALVETDRLAQLVDTLLAMTRGAQSAPAPVAVALGPVVEERAALWRPVATKAGVTLAVTDPFPVRVQVLPGALEQILDNLLSNALEVAPRGSTVRVSWRLAGTEVEVHVADAGPGLPAEQREQALEPFWRAPGARKGGTGLGLALVRTLAEKSGGRARLDPATPTGIDAVVVLPSADTTPSDRTD
ncbi:sensor histidine kinase [Paractinoplanes lichenicola]|uniref:histidine kinase n=1 Tax=Paractinoplanes lichenicola TaxID=2802976 RepID=A0ABS1VWK7_9ACTN|nr:HAMP domain-containing sensor histidine kinase [Actinoplanes lichenicola]MBL7258874.1 HAMP domain-containing histidine kinase [Actinoplanes lichenicola]